MRRNGLPTLEGAEGQADRKRVADTFSSYQSLPRRWHRAPRRWGHPLHSMASYLAMFPPSMPHVFIRWLTRPGEVVYDPFSGRGTTPFEACLLGRAGLGSDRNPLAALLTAARSNFRCVEALTADSENSGRLGLRATWKGSLITSVRCLLFGHWHVCSGFVRRSTCEARVDRYLMAVLAGSLHGNADKSGSVRGLTVPMPNTFAMAPGYIQRYVHSHEARSRASNTASASSNHHAAQLRPSRASADSPTSSSRLKIAPAFFHEPAERAVHPSLTPSPTAAVSGIEKQWVSGAPHG